MYDSWQWLVTRTQIFKFQICYLNHIWTKNEIRECIPRGKVDLYANFRKNPRIFKYFALFLTINRYYQMGNNFTVFWLCKVTPSKFRNMRISAKCNFWLCTAIPNRLSEVSSGDMWLLTLQRKFTPDIEIQKYIYDSWHSHTQFFKFKICYLNHIWAKTYVGEWISWEKADLCANFRKNRRMF